MNIPKGYVLVPVDSIKAIDMGWAYLDAAREAEPEKSHSFSHAGYRAMIAAAPPVEIPAYDEARERELFEEWYREKFSGGNERLKKCHNASDIYFYHDSQSRWVSWSACAQSRARSAE